MSLSGSLLVVFSVVWLALAVRGASRAVWMSGRLRWLVGVLSLLVVVGAAGFFASALSAIGVLKLPRSFEWPAGYVPGITRTADGKYIVPLVPSGRVQLYDAQWRFLIGWNVEAAGGSFDVKSSRNGVIEVLTSRRQRHLSYTESGDLIADVPSAVPIANRYYRFPSPDPYVAVPTSPVLLVFSNPIFCWGAMVVGGLGGAVVNKLQPSKLTHGPGPAR